MRISAIRSLLYGLAKLLGDLSALLSRNPEKIAKRAGRRVAGKVTGRALWRMFR
jgi:hypothetical protein